MKTDKKQRRHDYTALKRRLALRMTALAAGAALAVFLFRRLTVGHFADRIVEGIAAWLRVDYDTAYHAYFYMFRNSLEIVIAVIIILFVYLCFRLLSNALTRYFDEIVRGIDSLTENQSMEIKLSPELEFVENRLLKLQQALERKEDAARQSERRKNDLVIYSAHDIRTPLTSVLGYLTLLDGSPELPAGERKKYTVIALAKARELDGMISELFEITRYNLHDIALEKSRIDLCSMLLQMKEEHYPLLQSGGKQMSVTADETVTLYGDAEKLARAFNNLLKNAIAYSDPGSTIEVSAYLSEAAVTLQFKNRCRPIPQEKLNRLFDQFYRLDEARAANTGGAGLGLAIAKEIIALHGGTITAESGENGINFIVSLPASESE